MNTEEKFFDFDIDRLCQYQKDTVKVSIRKENEEYMDVYPYMEKFLIKVLDDKIYLPYKNKRGKEYNSLIKSCIFPDAADGVKGIKFGKQKDATHNIRVAAITEHNFLYITYVEPKKLHIENINDKWYSIYINKNKKISNKLVSIVQEEVL